jgi:acetyl-CoA acetyltransferase
MDTHYPGMRDLTRVDSARIAGAMAADRARYGVNEVDLAELYTEYSHQESLLVSALGLAPGVAVNPSGGPLAGRPMTATGLIRIGEAAQRILDGSADRALAHASSGPALQQNLVCLLSC